MSFESSKMAEIEYKCSNPKCDATDKGKFFPDEFDNIPPVIGCWKCKSGRGYTVTECLSNGVGMFRVTEHPNQVAA